MCVHAGVTLWCLFDPHGCVCFCQRCTVIAASLEAIPHPVERDEPCYFQGVHSGMCAKLVGGGDGFGFFFVSARGGGGGDDDGQNHRRVLFFSSSF